MICWQNSSNYDRMTKALNSFFFICRAIAYTNIIISGPCHSIYERQLTVRLLISPRKNNRGSFAWLSLCHFSIGFPSTTFPVIFSVWYFLDFSLFSEQTHGYLRIYLLIGVLPLSQEYFTHTTNGGRKLWALERHGLVSRWWMNECSFFQSYAEE